jgi:hypothetical protein
MTDFLSPPESIRSRKIYSPEANDGTLEHLSMSGQPKKVEMGFKHRRMIRINCQQSWQLMNFNF